MLVLVIAVCATAGGAASGSGGPMLAPKKKPSGQSMDELVMDDLWRILARNAARLTDLFRKWDQNGDGKIDIEEFVTAWASHLAPLSLDGALTVHGVNGL